MTNPARAIAIKKHRESRPDLAEQLAFFERLWDLQDELADKAAPYAAADADAAARALNASRSLFSLAEPTIPASDYRDAVAAVTAVVAEKAGLPEAQTAALGSADLAAVITDEGLAGALNGFDVFVQDIVRALDDEALTPSLVAFVLQEAMLPFLREPAKTAVEGAGRYDWMNWGSGLCPVCGTPASSGIVMDEGELQGGRRWLSCPTCRSKWEYARLRCARCGTRDMKQLEYLYDETDPGHRVHVCKSCHGYLPVSFEKDLKHIAIPEVEELVMVPLETVAASRGYSPLGDEVEETAN